MPRHELRAWEKRLERATFEIGKIVIEWGTIERVVDDLIELLTEINEKQISDVITGNIDFRGKIQIAKGLAFIKKPSDAWFKTTIAMLDVIDNDLRVRRNDVMHAYWISPKNRFTKLTKKTKLKTPQSFQLLLETRQEIFTSITDLKILNNCLHRARTGLLIATLMLLRDDLGEKRSREKPFLRYIHRASLDYLRKHAFKASTPARIASGVKGGAKAF